MPSTNLSFRTPLQLMDKIKSRDIKGVDNPGAIAKRDLERWYSLLETSLGTIRVEPVDAVIMIYAANLRLSAMGGLTLGELPHALREEMGLGAFYRDAQDSLAEEVSRWPMERRAALWDAAERYDVIVHRGPARTFGATLHEVGLHTYDLDAQELAVVESFTAVESDHLPAAYKEAVERADV